MVDEQEIYAQHTPFIADLIVSYETADLARQVEIISILVKECVIYTLDGPFKRGFEQLVQEGWLNKHGDIIRDTSLLN